MGQQESQIKAQVRAKYEYLTDDDIDTCYNMALHDFVRLSYPSENNRPDPQSIDIDFMTSQWLYARMLDILDRAGGTNVTAYRENGVSWTYANSYIDLTLALQIMPKGRVPR